eukprot:Nk52_evm86s485 gene=Nk52_evmTU86s485
MNTRNRNKYTRLPQGQDEFTDAQFKEPPKKIPYQAILLAVVLFVFGSVGLIFGCLIATGFIVDERYADRVLPLFFLGGLLFIPGAYHVRLALYAYKGYKGYSYGDIPEY